MKVLLLKDYFSPENCAGINLTNDLLEAIAKSGNEAEVFTPIPCRGINDEIRKEYRYKKKDVLYDGKVIVHRYWLPYEKKNIVSRALRYLLQNVIQIIKAVRCDYDIAFLGSTPPTMGIVGTIIKKFKKKPFVFNVQDVFPDSLVTTGITEKGSLIWKFGNWISDKSYDNADKIITISNSMKENLIMKGVPENKLLTIHNWIDADVIKPIDKTDNYLFDELNLPREKFYVVYAGNLGNAQGAEVIIDAAKLLKDNLDIHFVIFGNGTKKEEIESKILNEKLNNINLFNLRPSKDVPYVYSLGNISIITCKKGTGEAGLPSKTWSILATATMPIVCFDLNSDLSKLIIENNLGIAIEPEDSKSLKEAIEVAYSDEKKCVAMGQNGRKLVEKYYSKTYCTSKYIEALKEVIAKK